MLLKKALMKIGPPHEQMLRNAVNWEKKGKKDNEAKVKAFKKK